MNWLNFIKQGEGLNIEFKTNFNAEVIETLVAFANAKGGYVFIGVADDGTIKGVETNQESIQNWVNEIKQKTAPTLIPDIDVFEMEFRKVVIFSMQEYPIKPVAYRGRYYKRLQNANHLLAIEEVVNMHLKTINSSWDFHTNNDYKIDTISLEKVQIAIDAINQNGTNIKEDPINFLFKKDLIKNEKITNAAFLLFNKQDNVITTVELGRFQTPIIIKDNDRTQSDLISQASQIMSFVEKHINKAIIITDKAHHKQEWQYPMEAIREIVMNMIVHRDYRDAADAIVKIFDNHIEFFNPGRLPDSISENDLLENNYMSTPRNKLVAGIFKSMGLIEKYGSGIRRIIEYFESAGLPKPTFKNKSNGFLVTIYSKVSQIDNDPLNDPLNDRQINIISFIKKDIYITKEELANKCFVSLETIKRDIYKMQKMNIIERKGSRKTGYWQIITNTE